MEHIKNDIKNKLNWLSKEQLVDAIADLCCSFIFASAIDGLTISNRIQQCINNVQTDLRKKENLNEQKINDNFFSKQDIL